MAHETVLTLFVIVAAVAIVMQAWVMFGIHRSIQEIRREVASFRTDFKQRLEPLAQSVTDIVADCREPFRNITSNLAEISQILRDRSSHLDSVVAELVDKSRLQIIRVDQMVSGLVEKVESTAELVERQVLTPIHEVSAVLKGLRSGLEFLFSRRRVASVSEATQDEQLFI